MVAGRHNDNHSRSWNWPPVQRSTHQSEISMKQNDQDTRIKALAERSSYIENVLGHALVAELSSVVWSRDPFSSLQIFNSEVDDSGFDIVLGLGNQLRYVQLKQAHEGKTPAHCSIRLSFSTLPGSCVVLMSHSLADLRLTKFRFFGGLPKEPMPNIEALPQSKSPGRRTAAGERKVRLNYRDVPVKKFLGPLSSTELLNVLFPTHNVSVVRC